MATLKQQIDSLFELGQQIKEFNPSIAGITFKIENAYPGEMQAFADEIKTELKPLKLSEKNLLLMVYIPPRNADIIITVYSLPVILKSTVAWELPENIGELQPAAETPLTPFTTEMTDEEENEILHDIVGGTKY